MIATYANETQLTRLRVNLVNPGAMQTNLRKEAFPGEDPATLPTPDMLAEAILPLLLPDCSLHGAWVAADETLKAPTLPRA